MSNNNASTSGDAAATSGAAGDVSSETSQPQATSGASGKDSHTEKLLKEKRNAMEKIRELEMQLQAFQDERLTEKEQYKTLAEKRLEKINELESKITVHAKQVEKAKKVSAVKKHLTQLGLKPQHEELVLGKLLDVEDLVLDPDTGAVLGAEEKAKSFRQTYADLGFFGKSATGVNQDAPLSGKSVTTAKSIQNMNSSELKELFKQSLS